ncbi:hypothetical protein SMICM304S_11255 [Streptomyces microflavus]
MEPCRTPIPGAPGTPPGGLDDALLKVLFAQSAVGLLVLDPQLRLVRANSLVEGVGTEEYIGLRFTEAFRLDDPDGSEQLLKQVLAGEVRVRRRHLVRRRPQLTMRVAHRHPVAGAAEHRQVVGHVPEGDRPFGPDAQQLGGHSDPGALVDAVRSQLDGAGPGHGDARQITHRPACGGGQRVVVQLRVADQHLDDRPLPQGVPGVHAERGERRVRHPVAGFYEGDAVHPVLVHSCVHRPDLRLDLPERGVGGLPVQGGRAQQPRAVGVVQLRALPAHDEPGVRQLREQRPYPGDRPPGHDEVPGPGGGGEGECGAGAGADGVVRAQQGAVQVGGDEGICGWRGHGPQPRRARTAACA